MTYIARGGDPFKYVLGRGKVYVRGETLINGASPSWETWRDLGNVTAFTITQESEIKEHKSFLSGIATIDKQVPLSQKMTVSFTTDEVDDPQNLAHFLSGSLQNEALRGSGLIENFNPVGAASDVFDPGAGAGTIKHFYVDTLPTDFIFNQWFDIEIFSPGPLTPAGLFRAYDFGASQTVTVRKNTTGRDQTTGTILTSGTHYELDRKMGRVRFLEVAGGLTRGDSFLVHWAASADATKGSGTGIDSQLNKIKLLTKSGVTCALKFIQENPNNADKPSEYGFHKIQLKPEGEFSGIGDDWATLSFSGAVEAIASPPPGTSPYGWWVGRDIFGAA